MQPLTQIAAESGIRLGTLHRRLYTRWPKSAPDRPAIIAGAYWLTSDQRACLLAPMSRRNRRAAAKPAGGGA